MIPYPSQTLTELAVRVVSEIVPNISSTYGQADGGLIAGLLLTMAQDYERAVHNRMCDIAEIKTICQHTLESSFDGDKTELTGFLDLEPDSLLLKDVTTLHATAFTLLISIHTWAEQHDDAINTDIWRLLRRHSERNKFDIPGP